MKLLIKLARFIDADGRRVKVSDFEKHLVDETKDFHTKYGVVSASSMKKGGVVSAGKESFNVLDTSFIDLYKNMKRDAQIMMLKDLGAILALTGITKDSVVAEAGCGSGAATCFFAEHAKQVFSFDIENKNIDVAKENVKYLGLKNVTFKEMDVYATVPKIEVDLFILDVPEPSKAVKNALSSVKTGGFLVVYAPHIHQLQNAVAELPETILKEGILQVEHKQWLVDAQRSRPETRDVAHTGFLLIVRNLQ